SVTYHDVRFLEPAKTRNYLNVDYGAFSWLLTKDHKRIGILYMFSISLMFILGGFFAMMMRPELLTPEGDLLTSDTYNKLFTPFGAFIVGFSSILTGLNFLVTIHRMRAPGLTWFRLPLFVWAMYATSLVQLLATPVLAITLVMLMIERFLHVGIFDPALGGDPL